jgi:hypothetical protein
MLDVDTFLTTLYVIVDDFCQSHRPKKRPGPKASLSVSELLTLPSSPTSPGSRVRGTSSAMLRATSEMLSRRCPTVRSSTAACVPTWWDSSRRRPSCTLHLARRMMKAQRCPYEALDASAMLVRDAKRRGAGWLAGYADIGWSNSLGWYEGFRLLVAVNPAGVITGFGFACASTKDQPLAETFFALRCEPNPRAPSVGSAAAGPYVTDKGFEGEENHRRWLECYGARVVWPPRRNTRKRRWPKMLRRWVASIRQIVETVYEKLHNALGLCRERAHELQGLRARLAATVALHNFCIRLNEQNSVVLG